MQKHYDIVLFGATSFVGQITAAYLAKRLGNAQSWAIAGRSEAKLHLLLSSLPTETKPELIIADVNQPDSIANMCTAASVLISTVGPYAKYGEPIIRACIAAKTDYLDLTGEPQFIRRIIDKYQQQAHEANVRIVNSCGFDSIPSDMGVYFLQQHAQTTYSEVCQRIAMRVHRIKGGASGGTVASMLNVLDEVKDDPALRRVIGNPYALCPQGHNLKAYQPNLKVARIDEETQRWKAPFIMAAINMRIVHRSNALLNTRYGSNFVYDEAVLTGKGVSGAWKGLSLSFGLAGFMLAASITPIRKLLENKWLPKPGEGPSEQQQLSGMFDIRLYGYTPSGKRVVAKVTGDRDPGYGSTAKMLSEAAICLASNDKVKQKAGGIYTPASIFEVELIPPLIEHAGLSFEICGD